MKPKGFFMMRDHLRSCHGKHRHKSAGAASAQARGLKAKGDDELKVYHCKFCRHWHVGHGWKVVKDQ